MVESRTKKTFRNTTIGIISYLLNAGLSFVGRIVFIRTLGIEYLGIGGLFSNILVMLSLSDLGIYTVMTYSLYKPIAENDTKKITIYIHYFQKLYNIIAFVVLGIGLALIPILPQIVNGSDLAYNDLVKYYIILLANSVVSYFAISKSTLFRADQNVYIVRIITTVTNALMHVTQIILLVVFRNYVAYLVCQVCFTFGNNLFLSIMATKRYPYLREKVASELAKDVNSKIIQNLKASFLYKVGSLILNSTDNILISIIVSTVMVGYYTNYVTVFSLVNAFVMIIIEAVLASVGNYIATESDEKKYKLFRTLMLIMYIIAAFCVSCYIAGMNDFIRIWLGDKYIIGGAFIFALAINRFVFCSIHPLWMMRESSGVFSETQFVMIGAAVINLILSGVLGNLWGITGIILATAISYLLTVYWFEPIQLSKKIFRVPLRDYWKYVFRLLGACVLPLIFATVIYRFDTNNILFLLLKFLGCGVVAFFSFFVVFRNTEEYNGLYNMVRKTIFKISPRTDNK